jgi:hypothetical protein
MTYGVIREGFARKSLPVILAELEEAMIAEFGPDVIQTSQSPLGQINGLHADVAGEAWEVAEDVYQSFDVDGASGPRLDIIAKLRRLYRNDGESDGAFRLRISNQGQANIKLTANVNRLKNIPGVTFAWAIENSTAEVSAYGMPPHSVAYAISGGSDEAVGLMVYQLSVSGIGLYGNVSVPVIADGYCQQAQFIRPDEVRIRVEVDVQNIPDASGCAPPSAGQLQEMLIAAYAGDHGFKNGATVEERMIASVMAKLGDLEIVDVRIARQSTLIIEDAIETTIFERPVLLNPDVMVRYVA